MQTVEFCENETYCRGVLRKHWPTVRIRGDISTVQRFADADIVVGGFPCQDISLAGKRAGVSGKRSGLYRQMLRAIRMVRPRFAIMENVAALLGFGMGTVLGDVAQDGYDAEWDCISASDAGAPHGRDRVWITLTDPNKLERSPGSQPGFGWWQWSASEIEEACDANGLWQLQPPRLLGDIRRRVDNATREGTCWASDWQTQFEAFRGMDDGIPDGLDKSEASAAVKALGNTLVPQVPEIIGRAIMSYQSAKEAK